LARSADDAAERARLVQRLHEATALHFGRIRFVEVKKQEQRARAANGRSSILVPAAAVQAGNVPEERPAEMSPSSMFDPNTLYFGRPAGKYNRRH